MSTESKTDQLSVKIFSPFEIFYEGPASSLSATTATGLFDILYGHANFIGLLQQGKVVARTPYGHRSYEINRGVVKVHNNYVVVFANI